MLQKLKDNAPEIKDAIRDFIKKIREIIHGESAERRDWDLIKGILKAKLQEVIAKLKELIEHAKGIAGEVTRRLIYSHIALDEESIFSIVCALMPLEMFRGDTLHIFSLTLSNCVFQTILQYFASF